MSFAKLLGGVLNVFFSKIKDKIAKIVPKLSTMGQIILEL
jgi:hypothetical protein